MLDIDRLGNGLSRRKRRQSRLCADYDGDTARHFSRHFLVLEDAHGKPDHCHDEDESATDNDQIFLSLHDNEKLHDALERARERTANPQPDEVEPKVERLARQEVIDLKQAYYFQEALPNERFADALRKADPSELGNFSELLRTQLNQHGTFGGLSNQAGEIRLLAPSQEKLEKLQEGITSSLSEGPSGRSSTASTGVAESSATRSVSGPFVHSLANTARPRNICSTTPSSKMN